MLYFLLAKLFKFWIKEVVNLKDFPENQPLIFVANHCSYFDFIILGAIFIKKPIVFLAAEKIKRNFLLRILARRFCIVYINRDNPGVIFFRKLIRYLEEKKWLILFPEGTRSRSGKMLKPKYGFVKLAIKTYTPIIPIGIDGAYEILPPGRYIPRFKKCRIIFGEKIYISPDNPELEDIFFEQKNKKFARLTKTQLEKIALRIMEKIRIMINGQWNEGVVN